MSESIAGAFKSMKDKVTYTKKPEQTHAPTEADPVSLANTPAAIDPAIFVATAHIYESKKDFTAAKAEYQKALKIDPEHPEAILGLAKLHDGTGQFAAAEEHYRRATVVDPTNASAFNNLGLCLARQRKFDGAQDALSRAVQLDPKKVLYRNNLARVLVETGHAARAFDELIAVHVDDFKIHCGRLVERCRQAWRRTMPDSVPRRRRNML